VHALEVAKREKRILGAAKPSKLAWGAMPLSFPVVLSLLSAQQPLTTIAEQSGWIRTGRYDEVIQLCHAFQRKYPDKVRCSSFGTTPEGRPMLVLAASGDGALEPASAKKKNRPVVLLQGGIHAGEIDGKDAGFWLLRDLLEGKTLPSVLSRVTVVFVPVFNVDGHERFGRYHRPNQNGPEQMGWRVTAQNLNLNRDYTKADAPEMAAMLRLLQSWDPILYVDLHVTDGAQFEPDVSVLIEPLHFGDEGLRKLGQRIHDQFFQAMEAQKHLALDFYPSFVKDDDPASGFALGVTLPRFSTGYWPLRNRFAVLVETHSWKDYATRVRSTRDAVQDLLEIAAREGGQWLRAARVADKEDARHGGSEVPVAYKTTGKSIPLKFRGFAYTRQPSEVSGVLWTRYDPHKPQIWEVPLFTELEATTVVQLPAEGYLVPAGYAAWMSEKLRLHGFSFRTLRKTHPDVEVEAFRATEVKYKPESFEGHLIPSLKGAWRSEKRELPARSLFVPVAQPGRALLAYLMDPASADSFAAWGFFNACFEQKEYMENYVAEEAAREMMQRDPQLKAAFQRKVAEDTEFAKSPAARLRFFNQRHPSWDERYNLYPVYRVQRPLETD
jgi:murein tripeptide amidase MpaA